MAYSICYLIDLHGAEFNRLMEPSRQAPASYIEELSMSQESDLWDGRFPDNDMDFLVDLTGAWTLCILPIPYSMLLGAPPASQRISGVHAWEDHLRKLLPSTDIIRVDDFLLDPWNARHDYLLVRSRELVRDFIDWLRTQDDRYWSRWPTGRPAVAHST